MKERAEGMGLLLRHSCPYRPVSCPMRIGSEPQSRRPDWEVMFLKMLYPLMTSPGLILRHSRIRLVLAARPRSSFHSIHALVTFSL